MLAKTVQTLNNNGTMSAEAIPEITIEDLTPYVVDSQDDFVPERLTTVLVTTQDPIKDYLRGIAKVDLLTAEQEVLLSKSIEVGLLSERLLDIRTADDPLEYLQGTEAAHDSEVLAADPESFFASQEFKLGQCAAKFALSTSDEELQWLAEDGQQAKQHMLEANLRLVVSIAKKYGGRGMQQLDIIQEGNLGLIRGVEKFDFAKGFKFSTYATWWIKQAIARAIDEKNRNIRLPIHMAEKVNAMTRLERELTKATDHEPTIDELAEAMNVPRETVLDYKRYARDTVSLDTPIGDGGARYEHGSTLGELIKDEHAEPIHKAAEFTALQEELSSVLDSLTEKEAGIITMRFGLNDGVSKTLDDVGKVYGVTRERIRQIEAKTLCKLRHPSRSARLRDYLQ
jgi:RNA polymerase primary sigma factor